MTTEPDAEDVAGCHLDWILPQPVPRRYRHVPAEERAGRGRAALRLWLLGFRARTAWSFALSPRMDWRAHLPDGYHGPLGDPVIIDKVVQRRLRGVLEAEDWYVEMIEAVASSD